MIYSGDTDVATVLLSALPLNFKKKSSLEDQKAGTSGNVNVFLNDL